MKIVIILILCSKLSSDICDALKSSTCGVDGSPGSAVYAGVASIETYPWLGMLFYPIKNSSITTSVVLVTRQLVLAAASEIDKLPKTDFRAKARVVLGHKCDAGPRIGVRDYTYHPEYVKDSYSALAMIQLETDHIKIELRPICQPPTHFYQPQFFAMTLNENCKDPRVRIHRMKYVSMSECKQFYRRSGLDESQFWPRHSACARALAGGKCVWRSGSVLAVKQDGKWRLLGFSVYGPGCGDPARFLDYGRYHQWVQISSAFVGHPAITRMSDNHLVMRRSLANIQRYGPCDPEEKIVELYSDKVSILYTAGTVYSAQYNVTLLATFEYSCVTFKARPFTREDYSNLNEHPQPFGVYRSYVKGLPRPKIRLRRWCATASGLCHGFQHIEVQFYVDIKFSQAVEFTVYAYGTEVKVISPSATMKLANDHAGVRPVVPPYKQVLNTLKITQDQPYNWFIASKGNDKKEGGQNSIRREWTYR